MLKILPQSFYQNDAVKTVLADGLSCVIHKKMDGQVIQKEGYVSTHAITLVLQGQLRVENDKGFLANVQSGQMIFMPKGIYMISDIIPTDDVFEAVVFFFEEDLIASFIESIQLKHTKDKCVSHLILDYTKEIQSYTESLLTVYGNDKKHAHRGLTKLKLMELLHLIGSSTRPADCFLGALSTLNNKEKKSLTAFMEANFHKPLSIEDYAYLTGRSLSSFRRDFISQFGISPKQWLIEKRLDRAQQLLSNNHTTVTDVAAEIGYDNISHFVKAFHKRYGIPPKQFLMQRRKEVLV
jgi:AraC family transcriptional regulator, exoenzyme S synthesis regulatory protein ExsA